LRSRPRSTAKGREVSAERRLHRRVRRNRSIIERYHIKMKYLTRWKTAILRFAREIRSAVPSPRVRMCSFMPWRKASFMLSKMPWSTNSWIRE